MKVSLSWLKAYVDIRMDVRQLAESLTMAGLEVDSVSDRYGYLDTVVVGRIERVRRHPNAEKLTCCDVSIGDRILPIVCGAPNVSVGMNAPAALPGTELPDGTILEKGIIRGEISEGMLCSEAELALGPDPSGIMPLDGDFAAGAPLKSVLSLSDAVLDIDLTPNRPDCLSLLGIAREIAAIQNTPLHRPEIQLPDVVGDIAAMTSVVIDAPDLCPRYVTRLIESITIGPSPFWLQDRLLSIGLRPINNIVDVTNYVMMELGQPLHAFDFDRLAERRIVVRTALSGETFTTLDGKDRSLTDEMLMIRDGQKPVAVAGVMGGMNSEISDTTTRVLIESAYFNPASIRKTAKALGIGTEASHRFERGVDPHGTVTAANRAAQLMTEISGGRLIGGIIDAHPNPAPAKTVSLSVRRANRFLGTDFSVDGMEDILRRLEFGCNRMDSDRLKVTPPSFRVDVTRPQDLTEEIARIAGYNRIPTTFPLIPVQAGRPAVRLGIRNRLKRLMAGLGFHESINYSFVPEATVDRLRMPPKDPRRATVDILNPLSEDQSAMRTTLVYGLLENAYKNLSKQVQTVKLFEIGKRFLAHDGDTLPHEAETLAALWTGLRGEPSWHNTGDICDFYDLKGIFESLFQALHVPGVSFTALLPDSAGHLQPGQSARIAVGRKEIGVIGKLHPLVQRNFELKQAVFVCEIDLEALYPLIPEAGRAESTPKYPATARDATVIVDRELEAGEILAQVERLNEPLVENVFLFDVFDGKPIPEGKRSLSFRITYRSAEETLEDERINRLHKEIVDKIQRVFAADLPG